MWAGIRSRAFTQIVSGLVRNLDSVRGRALVSSSRLQQEELKKKRLSVAF